MAFAFEINYKPPIDHGKEERLRTDVQALGGRLDYREEPNGSGICLTFEFDDLAGAERAATTLRSRGEHVEGPYDYCS